MFFLPIIVVIIIGIALRGLGIWHRPHGHHRHHHGPHHRNHHGRF